MFEKCISPMSLFLLAYVELHHRCLTEAIRVFKLYGINFKINLYPVPDSHTFDNAPV